MFAKNPTIAEPATPLDGKTWGLLAAAIGLAAVTSGVMALTGEFPAQIVLEVLLALLAAALVATSTQGALCFAAFAIMPLGDLRREFLDITFNFPELLIHAIFVKEALRFLLRGESLHPRMPLWPLVLFMVTALLGVATGFFHGTPARNILQDFRQFSEFIVLFVLVLQRVHERSQVMEVLACFTLGAALIAVHGILQRYTGLGIPEVQLHSDHALYAAIRSSSFYGATALGGLMVLAAGPALGVALTARQRAVALAFAGCAALCLLAMLFTQTRASWLAMALALLYIVAFTRPSMRIAAIAMMGLLFFAALMGPSVVERLSTLSAPKADESLMDRTQYYTAAAHIAMAHPLLGLGWGCYYDIEAILAGEGYVATPRPADAPDATVHSAYLQLLVKSGLAGLVGFLGVVFVWFERLWSARRPEKGRGKEHVLTVCIAGGVLGYLAHSAFENFFQWAVMAQSFWLLIGLSYVMAARNAPEKRNYRTPLLAAAAITGGFLLFMGFCLRLETYHTHFYERNVARALEAGNPDKALDIAHRAATRLYNDPMAQTVYGRTLLGEGRLEEGVARLEAAFIDHAFRAELGFTATGKPYYFAPARLALGAHYARLGQHRKALAQFELARAYEDLTGPAFAEFHETLYAAYAAMGLWPRALEFGEPEDAALERASEDTARAIASAAEGLQQWPLILRLAGPLLGGDTGLGMANYLLGRAQLESGHFAAAAIHLDIAMGRHYPGAAFFLGTTLEARGENAAAAKAYVSEPAGSLYRPFALARAWALLRAEPGAAQGTIAQVETLLREAVAETIAGMTPLGDTRNPIGAGERIATRHGLPTHPPPHDRFPVLVLWEEPGHATVTSPPRAVNRLERHDNRLVLHVDEQRALDLQWTENVVLQPMGGNRQDPEKDRIPGWIDGGRDWFEVRPETTLKAEHADTGEGTLEIRRQNWAYSVPVRIGGSAGYMLSARVEAGGTLTCQALDETSSVQWRVEFATGKDERGWKDHACFFQTAPAWEALRLMLHNPSDTKPVRFGALGLMAIKPMPAAQPMPNNQATL